MPIPLVTPNTSSSNCRENMSLKSLKLLSRATLMPLLQRNKGNSKEIYKICNNLLGCNMLLPLADYTNRATLAQSFNEFLLTR